MLVTSTFASERLAPFSPNVSLRFDLAIVCDALLFQAFHQSTTLDALSHSAVSSKQLVARAALYRAQQHPPSPFPPAAFSVAARAKRGLPTSTAPRVAFLVAASRTGAFHHQEF